MKRVLTIGDTHCPVMLDDYIDFLVDKYKWWQCDTVVHIGDVVDWESISFHAKRAGTPNPNEEARMARKQVKKLYKAFPKAIVMSGNHDVLPLRNADVIPLPDGMMKSNSEFWETPKWDWKPRYCKHLIDDVIYQHGDGGSQGEWGYVRNAKGNFCSLVQGHAHASFGVHFMATHRQRCFGMAVGWGGDHNTGAMEYGMKFPRKPIVGCGIVLEGKFPILEPMEL